MNGATTVLDRVVNPGKAAVEKATGHTLSIIGNATGRGLVDLVDGKADIAMVSEPLPIAIEAAKLAGKEIDPAKLQFSVIRNDEIVFVTHKSNPVKALTWAQVKDIHTGKIKNWKEVGGNDLPITVFADAATGGTRAMIRKIVLDGQDFGPDVKTQPAVKKAAEATSQNEGGIAGVGKGFADDFPLNILQSKKLDRPLGFVTLGAPTGKAEQVITAFKATAK